MIEVKKLSQKEWKLLSESAHIAAFGEPWDKELERIDFALLMVNKETNTALSYATVQKMDENTVYLQYGGAFESSKGTMTSYLSFKEMLCSLKKEFKRIKTLVENDNYPMLKFYMKENFLITGIRFFRGHVLLENTYESFS